MGEKGPSSGLYKLVKIVQENVFSLFNLPKMKKMKFILTFEELTVDIFPVENVRLERCPLLQIVHLYKGPRKHL
jgi:hypothetical protein